jgi:hypothetical protein
MADGSGQNKVLLAQKLHHYMNDLIALLITAHSSTFLGPVHFCGPMGRTYRRNRREFTENNQRARARPKLSVGSAGNNWAVQEF